MYKKDYSELFNEAFLTALSNWQNGWKENQIKRRELADKLVEACEFLPKEFKECNKACYRKRFIVGGEIVPIILDDTFFEGIASWSFDIDFTKNFKGLVNPATKFAMIFKHIPHEGDVIVNICELWKNNQFKKSVKVLNDSNPEIAKPLLNFKDLQSEIILRSNLRGSDIQHIVSMSSSFEEIFDMANIPENKREEFSIKYARDTDGIPIELPIYASERATSDGVANTISKMKALISNAESNNMPIYNLIHNPHKEDLKHKKSR
jgi:hypothetical protein